VRFSSGYTFDSFSQAAKYVNALHGFKSFPVDGWKAWTIRLTSGVCVRLRWVRDRIIPNTNPTLRDPNFQRSECTHDYYVAIDGRVLRPEYAEEILETHSGPMTYELAHELWSLNCFPELLSLGQICGIKQEVTMKWNNHIFMAEFPRILLERHENYLIMARQVKRKKDPVQERDICVPYIDRIRDGEIFPIVDILNSSDYDWIVRIEGDDGHMPRMLIPEILMASIPDYRPFYLAVLDKRRARS